MAWEPHIAGPNRAAAFAMAVHLARPPDHPDRIAVTKTGVLIDGGRYFLDFCRPIEIQRRFGRLQSHVGLIMGLLVPVIHEAEERGTRVIAVDHGDPRFDDLCKLWAAHYPDEVSPPWIRTDIWSRTLHFAAHFPCDH